MITLETDDRPTRGVFAHSEVADLALSVLAQIRETPEIDRCRVAFTVTTKRIPTIVFDHHRLPAFATALRQYINSKLPGWRVHIRTRRRADPDAIALVIGVEPVTE